MFGSPRRSPLFPQAVDARAAFMHRCAGHSFVETGKGLDAAAIWSAGLSAFSASGLSSADSDYVWQKIEPAAKTSGYPQPA